MVNINFQPDTSPVPSGYIKDIGDPYSSSRGFGWVQEDSLSTTTHTPLDIKANSRDRSESGIGGLNTLVHLQYPESVDEPTAVRTPAAWEYDIANGTYNITVSVGDHDRYDSQHTINVEGVNAINDFQGSSTQKYLQATVQVEVNDGKLTVDAIGGTNTKLNYINIDSADGGVSAAAVGPEIDLLNLDSGTSNSRLIFNRIGYLSDPPVNDVHDVARLRVKNIGTGSAPLRVTGLSVTGPWQLTRSFTATNIASGSYLDVGVRFIANSGDVHKGTLTIRSNDSNEASKAVTLAGFWQRVSEGGQEPSLYEIASVLGYTTRFTSRSSYGSQRLNQNGLVQTTGDEVFSPYWQRADTSRAVGVRQLASYHTYGNPVNLSWYTKGNTDTTNLLFTAAGAGAQSLLPLKSGSTQYAAGTFNTNNRFGFKIDSEWSDPTLNRQSQDSSPGPNGHHVRFWQVRNQSGQLVANTYLMVMDYSGINYDYNDNVYLISNVKPESRTALYRIDVGSNSSYTSSNGNVWSSDRGYYSSPTGLAPAENGGSANPRPSINYTTNDRLYQTYRGNVGNSTPQANRILDYSFNVAAGTKVEVRLHFAELYWGAPGRGPADTGNSRVFDVIAEGRTVMNNYNISEAAGGALSATRTFVRDVRVGSDGKLDLRFKAEEGFASIAAIEVLRM